jgi:hypothetical protein
MFASRKLSRRQALAAGTGVAVASLAAGNGSATAQDATPVASPAVTSEGGFTGEKITYLFVQSYQAGSIAPKAGVDGRYTVTLEQGLGQTLYFGDRPSRDVGAAPTPDFLEGLGFTEDNPPNAALLVETATGETDIAVVELYNPTYDETTHTATYEISGLETWQDDLTLGLQEDPADLATLAPQFGAAHLFIDDCDDEGVTCWRKDNGAFVGEYTAMGFCWNYWQCMPCEPYGHTQPDRCSTSRYWDIKCDGDFLGYCGDPGCMSNFPAAQALGCN